MWHGAQLVLLRYVQVASSSLHPDIRPSAHMDGPIQVLIPNRELEPLFVPREEDDLSTHRHRQLIGILGLVLPLTLWLISAARTSDPASRWQVLDSISAYYYSGAVAAFVGILIALGLFLFSYRGYANKYRVHDTWAARIAGLAAILLAVFPTEALDAASRPAWWGPITGRIHYGSAIVLFGSFAYFALYLFRRGSGTNTRSKRQRNALFLTCGLVILLSLVWAAIAGAQGRAIFWPETLALAAFATSWLAKGRLGYTVGAITRNLLHHPGRSAKAVKAALKGDPAR